LQRPPFDCIALLLQGGGALGAYQAGAYEALAKADLHPDWVAGISIGSINAAIIAGNPPENRVQALQTFWEHITRDFSWDLLAKEQAPLLRGDFARGLFTQWSSTLSLLTGQAGFFKPRLPSPWMQPTGTTEATSF